MSAHEKCSVNFKWTSQIAVEIFYFYATDGYIYNFKQYFVIYLRNICQGVFREKKSRTVENLTTVRQFLE